MSEDKLFILKINLATVIMSFYFTYPNLECLVYDMKWRK